MEQETKKFKKECSSCGKMFRPLGKFQRMCQDCITKKTKWKTLRGWKIQNGKRN